LLNSLLVCSNLLIKFHHFAPLLRILQKHLESFFKIKFLIKKVKMGDISEKGG
jgi:hypothetical protein